MFRECVLSQCGAVSAFGPERYWIVIWKVPVPVGCEWTSVPHDPVHVSRNCRDLFSRMVSTVGDRGCDKALLHFVAAGPSLHGLELHRPHQEVVLVVISPLAQEVLQYLLKHRCQLPGSYVVSGKHLTKPVEACSVAVKSFLKVPRNLCLPQVCDLKRNHSKPRWYMFL